MSQTETNSTTAKPHGFVTRSIHWLSAGLIAFGYFKGLNNVSQLSDQALLRSEIIFACVLGLVFMLRLIWVKSVGGMTRLPANAPRWEAIASQAVHYGLYGSVFLIVLSGLAIALGYSVAALSGIFLTAMIGLHEFALAALPVLLVVHIIGALWHKFVRRDGIMESMTGKISFGQK